LLGQTSDDVNRLLSVLQAEGWNEECTDDEHAGVGDDVLENVDGRERPRGA
jgi:hypothetical protein